MIVYKLVKKHRNIFSDLKIFESDDKERKTRSKSALPSKTQKIG